MERKVKDPLVLSVKAFLENMGYELVFIGKGSFHIVKVFLGVRNRVFCPFSYSSPHVIAVRERIRINGQPLSENAFASYFWEVYDQLNERRVIIQLLEIVFEIFGLRVCCRYK